MDALIRHFACDGRIMKGDLQGAEVCMRQAQDWVCSPATEPGPREWAHVRLLVRQDDVVVATAHDPGPVVGDPKVVSVNVV